MKQPDFKRLYDHALDIAAKIGHPTTPETFNPVVVDFYRVAGYLPDAIINYLLLLGWSLDDSREEFSRAEMIELFTLERVNKSPASFDPQKLWAFQDRHMRGMPVDEQGARGARSICRGPGSCRRRRRRASGRYIARVIAAAGDRIKTMGDILQFREFFVADDALPIAGAEFDKALKAPGAVALLREFAARLESVDSFEPAALEQELKAFVAERNLKVGAARASAAVRRDGPDRRAWASTTRSRSWAASARSRASGARRRPAAEAPAATLAASLGFGASSPAADLR